MIKQIHYPTLRHSSTNTTAGLMTTWLTLYSKHTFTENVRIPPLESTQPDVPTQIAPLFAVLLAPWCTFIASFAIGRLTLLQTFGMKLPIQSQLPIRKWRAPSSQLLARGQDRGPLGSCRGPRSMRHTRPTWIWGKGLNLYTLPEGKMIWKKICRTWSIDFVLCWLWFVAGTRFLRKPTGYPNVVGRKHSRHTCWHFLDPRVGPVTSPLFSLWYTCTYAIRHSHAITYLV